MGSNANRGQYHCQETLSGRSSLCALFLYDFHLSCPVYIKRGEIKQYQRALGTIGIATRRVNLPGIPVRSDWKFPFVPVCVTTQASRTRKCLGEYFLEIIEFHTNKTNMPSCLYKTTWAIPWMYDTTGVPAPQLDQAPRLGIQYMSYLYHDTFGSDSGIVSQHDFNLTK